MAEFSTIDALQAPDRLDARFLSKLLVKHSSGVWVLAAPGRFPQYQASTEAIDGLMSVARQEFDNVVVDMGSKLDLMGTSVYKDATTVYLVTQASIPELRNSNRLISQFFTAPVPKLEIVINRFEPRALGVLGGAHHQSADPAGAMEDSQRLCRRCGRCRSMPRRWCWPIRRSRARSRKWRMRFQDRMSKSEDGQEERLQLFWMKDRRNKFPRLDGR